MTDLDAIKAYRNCPKCGGNGVIVLRNDTGPTECPVCHLTGHVGPPRIPHDGWCQRCDEFVLGYGYMPEGGDPRHFTPDDECTTPAEMARWEADCARMDAGESVVVPGPHEPIPGGHVTRAWYGLGVYRHDCSCGGWGVE